MMPYAGYEESPDETAELVFDLTHKMASLDCTEDDMERALDILMEMLTGARPPLQEYVCRSGAVIRIRLTQTGVEISTYPEVQEEY